MNTNKITEIAEVLDTIIGDTEPYIDPEWTDEEIRDEEPLFWAVRELYKYTSVLEEIEEIVTNCIEINIDNYSEDQVEEVNNKIIDVHSILSNYQDKYRDTNK